MSAELALWLWVLTGFAALQLWLSSSFGAVANVLFKVQAIYWWLSFVARPLYLTAFTPGAGQVLYDFRMARLGYESTLLEALPIIVLGQGVFLGTLLALRPKFKRAADEVKNRLIPMPLILLLTFLAIAWGARMLTLQGVGLPGFVMAFSHFAPAMAIAFWPRGSKGGIAAIAVIASGEFGWALIGATKTPILAVILAILIRVTIVGGSRYLRRWAIPAAVVVLGAFILLQPLRGIETTAQAEAQGQSGLEALAATVLERTDTLSPVVDAMLLPSRPWLSVEEYAESALTGMVPTGVHEAVGVRWTREVKSYSFLAQYQDVYIASGVTAEGYAQGGLWGVAIENALLVMVTLLAARGLQSRTTPLAVAASVIVFDSAIYEGGLLWIAETGSGAVVAGSLAWIILKISTRARFSRAQSDHSTLSTARGELRTSRRSGVVNGR
jgi:hypothetical protein